MSWCVKLSRPLPFLVAALFTNGISSWCAEWSRHAFTLPESIWSVEAVDVNADGQLDLIAMGESKVYALTAPTWRQSIILDTVEPKMLYCVALDADDDGDLDIAIGRYRVPWIEHREAVKNGKNGDAPKGPEFSVAWIENTGQIGEQLPLHVIDRELNGIHGLTVADVNGDGRKDLIADSIIGPSFPNSLVWFETPDATNAVFKRHIITKNGADGRPHYLDTADINRDGKPDVLLGDSKGGTFTWWQQPTTLQLPWTKHRIGQIEGATNIRPGDVDGDGSLDVIGSCGHGKGVFWFKGGSWSQHAIDPEFATPHALAVGDLDGDGDLDVAAASFSAYVVKWYRNNGRGSFQTQEIDAGNKQQAYDLKTVDLNADARLDLILAGRETKNVVWYRNDP